MHKLWTHALLYDAAVSGIAAVNSGLQNGDMLTAEAKQQIQQSLKRRQVNSDICQVRAYGCSGVWPAVYGCTSMDG